MKTAFVRESLSLQTLFALLVVVMLTACSQQEKSTYVTVEQEGGPTLGYSPQSGVKALTIDGLKFKDLNRNDSLDGYEDWRLSSQQRAADLASKLSIEEIAGLMLYSAHQAIPMNQGKAYSPAHYGGKTFEESGAQASDLTDEQTRMIVDFLSDMDFEEIKAE